MTSVDATLALELRVRLLEALVSGWPHQTFSAVASSSSVSLRPGSAAGTGAAAIPATRTLTARSARASQILHATVKENASLAAFVRAYDRNLPFLTPAFALNEPGSNPVEEELRQGGEVEDAAQASSAANQPIESDLPLSALALPPQAQAALLLELEPDLLALERQLAECKVLDDRGSAGAGTLAESETLAPRLKAAWDQHEKRRAELDDLERTLARIYDSYSGYTDAASQVFIAWDEMLTSMELRVSREEKLRLQDV